MTRIAVRIMVVLAAAVSTWAQAFNDDPSAPFDATRRYADKISVAWRLEKDVQRACEQESRRRGNAGFGYAVDACSFWFGSECTIITREQPTMHTLGHELRHCFQRNWH
jgi:hypothetical protein